MGSVMSSRLCKYPEGAIFPLLIEPVKNREGNPAHALDIDRTGRGSSPASDLDKTPLNSLAR